MLSLFYIPVFISAVNICLSKRKENAIILLWFVPLLLYLSFGSSSLTEYIPFRAVDRYTSIITIPAILVMAVFLSESNKKINRALVTAALIILLILSIGVVYIRDDRNLLGNLKYSYAFINNLEKPVYIDERSLNALDFISGYKLKSSIRPYPGEFNNVMDSYVVINDFMIKNLLEANKNRVFPEEINNPPETWQVVKDIGVVVYYIPT